MLSVTAPPRGNILNFSSGAALIMVLASLLALSVVVFSVTEKVARQSGEAALLVLEYKASLKARTGLEIGLEYLREPDNGLPGAGLTVRDMTWSQQGLSVSIVPCSARINLDLLDQANAFRQRVKSAVLEMFAGQGLPGESLDYLLHWAGYPAREDPYVSTAMIQEFYQNADLDYSPPERDIARPEELLLIPGFEGVEPEWIGQNFTVWGGLGGLDINFTCRETALAFLPELEPYWDRVESFRQSQGITHPNQLLTEIGMDIASYSAVLPYIVLESEVFEIIVEVREGSWYEKHRYIVQRDIMDMGRKAEVINRDVLEARVI